MFTKPFPRIAPGLLVSLAGGPGWIYCTSCTDGDTEPTVPQGSNSLMDREKVKDEDKWVAMLCGGYQ